MTELPSYRTILCATDGSEMANQAHQHAVGLARQTGATLLLVAVVDSHAAFGMGIHRDDALRELRADARRTLADAERLAREHGVTVRPDLTEGTPGETIVRLVEEQGVDLVVIGANGQGALADIFLGSVSQYVLRHSRAPVCVVRVAFQP